MAITAIYPGSFDPVHLGHLDVLETTAKLFDKVIWAIGTNMNKKYMFSLEDRLRMMNLVASYPNVKVAVFSGLLAQYAERRHNAVIVRSLRTNSDFEFEFQMTIINRRLAPNIQTIYIPAKQEHAHLSSTAIRELITHHHSIKGFVPDLVEQCIRDLKLI